MKPAGTDRKNVTNDSARDSDPAYSPDGKKIAYESYNCDTQGCADGIFVVDANGTEELKRLTNNLGSSSIGDYDPTWSPDGTKIAFASNRDHHAPVTTTPRST